MNEEQLKARIKNLKISVLMMSFLVLIFSGLYIFEILQNENKVTPGQVEVARLQIKKDLLLCITNIDNVSTVQEYSQKIGNCFDSVN